MCIHNVFENSKIVSSVWLQFQKLPSDLSLPLLRKALIKPLFYLFVRRSELEKRTVSSSGEKMTNTLCWVFQCIRLALTRWVRRSRLEPRSADRSARNRCPWTGLKQKPLVKKHLSTLKSAKWQSLENCDLWIYVMRKTFFFEFVWRAIFISLPELLSKRTLELMIFPNEENSASRACSACCLATPFWSPSTYRLEAVMLDPEGRA